MCFDGLGQKDAKKYLMPLNAISGTHIEKFRLLEGKSTQINENREMAVSLQTTLEELLEAQRAHEIESARQVVQEVETVELPPESVSVIDSE